MRKIGQGVCSTVWEHQETAIKVIKLEKSNLGAVTREIYFGALEGERLIGYTSFSFHCGELRITMPLGERFQIKDSFKTAVEFLLAVHELHSRGIQHNDLKPENLIIVNDTLKIIDYSISRPCWYNPNQNKKMITRWYRPPEFFSNEFMFYETEADIWSVGCLIYEIYAEEVLFPSDFEDEHLGLVDKILKNLGKLTQKFPQNISRVISLCLNLDPSKRPSCRDLLLLLEYKEEIKTYIIPDHSKLSDLPLVNPKKRKEIFLKLLPILGLNNVWFNTIYVVDKYTSIHRLKDDEYESCVTAATIISSHLLAKNCYTLEGRTEQDILFMYNLYELKEQLYTPSVLCYLRKCGKEYLPFHVIKLKEITLDINNCVLSNEEKVNLILR